ncbi:FkbM family methyltransferase [Tardiphaga alba]|uniref:FkbM family methyltransferase n=1 Tax=Tardiphaga alba TaxID=340268 RepID=A0ABX8AA72_9BRAD|nr:FkbM family methyltransferase [Tardiphaga alba]QUS40479.1 FkbM family methyltransferase [Tardiphaga alba]
MGRSLSITGTLRYLGGLLTPWRSAYKVFAVPSNHAFFVTPHDVVGRHISKYGSHEPVLTAWIRTHLSGFAPGAGIVIDVGANLGWHAVHAAKLASVTRVVAYEPDAFNAWLLDRNIAQNDATNVIVTAAAVGGTSGVAELHSYKSSNKGRHSLAFQHGLRSRSVPLVTLDDSLQTLGIEDAPVLLIKIDVEGYEPEVLAGATATLNRTRAVITEFDPSSGLRDQLAPQRVIDLLMAAQFDPHLLSASGSLEPADIAAITAAGKQVDLIWLKRGG